MAPRRLASRGATAVVNFDNTRFQSQDVEERYRQFFENWGMLIERNVHLPKFSGTPIPQWFERLGWTPFLVASGEAYVELVQEFYSNMYNLSIAGYSFDIFARGWEIHINREVLATYMNIEIPFGY
ncbi:hypothetical protein U1Q18_008611 [Sarracenia purpurea var. burkii]